MEGVAQQTEQARTVRLKMTSGHGKAKSMADYLSRISSYLRGFPEGAEQLGTAERWPAMLRQILYKSRGGAPPLHGGIRPGAAA